jgi:acyl carrier protein
MPNASELEKYYKALTDQELLNLKREGGFTAQAELVLGEEMAHRNLGSGDLKRYAVDRDLTFDEFAAWLREYWVVPNRKEISPETQFERDLGLTGDDGDDLLMATEKEFEVRLSNEESGLRETFDLQPNEFLFNSEGWGPSPAELISLFSSSPSPTARSFTVGELFEAVRGLRAKDRDGSTDYS